MTTTKRYGNEPISPNPILVAFFQEVYRLAEEVTRREEAATLQTNANNVLMEGNL